MIGQVYKAHSDKYLVKSKEGVFDLRARGVLKIKSNGISVGDFVEFEKDSLTKVLDRKNHFIRPNVSNVDLIVCVVSPEPKPDYYLIDKLLISSIKENVEFIIVVNKEDVDADLIWQIKKEYEKLDIEVYSVCAKTKRGIESIKEKLEGKLSVLAGQSAVGKTTIINSIFGLDQKTGELSEKTLRGRHTTTRSEIFEFENIRLIDSPGFAVIEANVNIDELPQYYPEYFEVSNECKYRGCSHINEPQCKVKELIADGKLSKSRYQRYKEIYEEISKRRVSYEKD